jgi:hypothetical protein
MINKSSDESLAENIAMQRGKSSFFFIITHYSIYSQYLNVDEQFDHRSHSIKRKIAKKNCSLNNPSNQSWEFFFTQAPVI